MGSQFANFLAKTKEFTNPAVRQLNQILKVTKDLEDKDLRDFQISFKLGDYKEENSGISIKTKFGIVDSKQEPVIKYRESLGFSEKESWAMIKFYIDDDETPEQVVERIKRYKVVRMLEKYVKVYNQTNRNEANFIPAKLEIRPYKNELSIIVGI